MGNITDATKELIKKRLPKIGDEIENMDIQILDLERVVVPKNEKINHLKKQKQNLVKEKDDIEKDLK